jgi:hypothetical protein
MPGGDWLAAHFCSLLVLGCQPVEIKKWVADNIKIDEKTEYWKGTYNIVRDLVLENDHVPVHMNWYLEQMFFPFFTPQLIWLGDEKGRNPIW